MTMYSSSMHFWTSGVAGVIGSKKVTSCRLHSVDNPSQGYCPLQNKFNIIPPLLNSNGSSQPFYNRSVEFVQLPSELQEASFNRHCLAISAFSGQLVTAATI
jgi:hypothetical protein